MTFITSERYKEELKRNLSFCHKFRSVPRSFQKELVPVTVPQKGTSSRNVRYLNEVLERTVPPFFFFNRAPDSPQEAFKCKRIKLNKIFGGLVKNS